MYKLYDNEDYFIMLKKHQLLTAETMKNADAETIARGTSGVTLMEQAGNAVTQLITEHNKPKPTLVVCGPGNNGGDGWVVARRLSEKKWPVKILSLVPVKQLSGDAAHVAHHWDGPVHNHWDKSLLEGTELIIDAIFGIGLNKPVDENTAEIICALNEHPAPIVSIDIPSGIHADTGEVLGTACNAVLTVTFSCKKPGHILLPGKSHCRLIAVTDIGIPVDVINHAACPYFENIPDLWTEHLPQKRLRKHKYDYGHVMVLGGPMHSTGASRMSATSALRTGAGLVSIVCPEEAVAIYASHLTSVMLSPCKLEDNKAFAAAIEGKYKHVIVMGPGAGITESTKQAVLTALSMQKKCIIDADALTCFKDNPQTLFDAIDSEVILTPHEGEFSRLFPDITGSKLERARDAAKQSGATVLLKGNDTAIASPDGRVALNSNAPAFLGTAGSGDVLSGIIAGIFSQHVPAFESACIGTWIHSETASKAGRGLMAEDLPAHIPEVLAKLYK